MAANEMPERIYIFDYNDAMVTPMEGDTVYIREDAFIEKAAKWLKENLSEYYDGEDIEYSLSRIYNITVLENKRMLEDFKKYMKGE